MECGTSVHGRGTEKSEGRWTWQNWALSGRWLPGSGRLGVCVWRSPPDQKRVTRAMFVRQLDTW